MPQQISKGDTVRIIDFSSRYTRDLNEEDRKREYIVETARYRHYVRIKRNVLDTDIIFVPKSCIVKTNLKLNVLKKEMDGE